MTPPRIVAVVSLPAMRKRTALESSSARDSVAAFPSPFFASVSTLFMVSETWEKKSGRGEVLARRWETFSHAKLKKALRLRRRDFERGVTRDFSIRKALKIG